MLEKKRIGLRDVRLLKPKSIIWDAAVQGFGARRQRSPAISYVVYYRTAEGRQRWHTIGRHGAPWTPDSAREEATKILGAVAGGSDPAEAKRAKRHAVTITNLCDLYLADAEAGRLLTRRKSAKKVSTLITDRSRIASHIKPLLGRMTVAAVTREDIEDFMNAVAEGKTAKKTKTEKRGGLANVRGGRGAASRTVGLLGAIFTYAVRHRMRLDNPVRGVTRYADGRRERRLSDDEYKTLGIAIQQAKTDGIWPAAVAAARFLIVTGWRRGEVLGLRWDQVDLARRTARLGDTKTGLSVRPLSLEACSILRGQGQASDLVFSATRGDGAMTGFPKIWLKIIKLGLLSAEITPHVLRHSFASLAADMGFSDLTIAALIGHKSHSMTSRYIHAADAVLLAAADDVAERSLQLMSGEVGNVLQLRRGKIIPAA
jgi:integrase